MLQSVDWGAVAFGIVLVELDGKNATKDTGVRHLLAAQGHVDQLVKVTPVLCEHCAPIPYPSISRHTLARCHTQPKQPRHLWDRRQGHLKAPMKYRLATFNTGVRWEHRSLLPRRNLAQRPPRTADQGP